MTLSTGFARALVLSITCFLKNLEAMAISAIIDYQDQDENSLTRASLELAQSGFLKGAWFDLPEDVYQGDRKVSQEFLDISVGPLITIKAFGYQASERTDKNQLGGFDQFQIRVFRNTAMIGGKPVEVFDFGPAEAAEFDQLRDYFLDKDPSSSIRKQKEALSLLAELQLNRA